VFDLRTYLRFIQKPRVDNKRYRCFHNIMQDVFYLIAYYVSYLFTFIRILDIDPFVLEPTCTYLSLKIIYNPRIDIAIVYIELFLLYHLFTAVR